ncbi:MAG: hypothetical protein P8183_20270 [Anaerolineae bacterium]
MTITDFVDLLANTAVPPHTYNPYSLERPENATRRHNLDHYLRQMQQRQPTILLVGEAPGYRGCRLTGIPFVSPAILQAGTSSGLFGVGNGWQLSREWPEIQREASATIVSNSCSYSPSKPLSPWATKRPRRSQAGESSTAKCAIRRTAASRHFNVA